MIQLAYPAALAALVAIPLLLVLHLLQPRRRRVVLSSIALWQAALRDQQGAHGLRRLPRSLSLLLLLAAALLLGLALAGPQWLMRTAEGGHTVLVLDVSASMKSRAGTGTRFDRALAEAAAIVERLPRDGHMLVMTSGRKALLKSGFESDRGALRRMLRELAPTDEAGRPREALTLALSLLGARENGRVYFITDGAFDPQEDPRSPQVVFRLVGAPARNIAITRFDLRQEHAADDRFQVLLTVRNFTDAPAAVPASASLDGRALFERTVELAAKSEQTLVLGFAGRAVGQAAARIAIDDDLAADNTAFAALDAPPTLHVLLVGTGNFYLRSVLQALPGIALDERDWAPPQEELAQLARAYDIVVFDGIPPPRLSAGNFLLVDAVAPGLPFVERGALRQPPIAGIGNSALMRDIDLSAVRIDQARRVVVERPGAGLQRLFWSPETDLALALIDDGLKVIYLGFDPARSNFPLQAAFPLFIRHSVEWLQPRTEQQLSAQMPAGVSYSIHAPQGQEQMALELPSGAREMLTAQDGIAQFTPREAGIYRYRVGDALHHVAVNLADPRESDVARRWSRTEQMPQAEAAADDAQALLPLWPYLLAATLLLLVAEWWVWSASRRHG